MKPTLTSLDFARAAAALGCTVPAIRAVCAVEAPNGGFGMSTNPDDPRGPLVELPTVLFERHKFAEMTGYQFNISHPDLSSREPGGYGPYKAQHERLARAAKLDRVAALKATSWGKFQIMGFNHVLAGHAVLQTFINAMYESEARQLEAFVALIMSDRRKAVTTGLTMREALLARDWASFAVLYNGRNFAINKYDVKLADAHTAALRGLA